MKIGAVIVCAGRGRRLGRKQDKAFIVLGGKPLFFYSYRVFLSVKEIQSIIIVARREQFTFLRRYIRKGTLCKEGGRRRQDSVLNGVTALPEDITHVLVHDGARPFVRERDIRELINNLKRYPAVTLGLPCREALTLVDKGRITRNLERRGVYTIQTPQGFKKDMLIRGLRRSKRTTVYDDTQAVAGTGRVKVIRGDPANIKITYPEDLAVARGPLLKVRDTMMQRESKKSKLRIGLGLDIHAFSRKKRKLILAGIEIDPHSGLDAVSDGDVVLHAVCDALLGAAGLGDIGDSFPPSAGSSRGISSKTITAAVLAMVRKKRFHIVNIDITVIAQKPRLVSHKKKMTASLKKLFSTDEVNLKIKSKEGGNFLGDVNTISCVAVLLLSR